MAPASRSLSSRCAIWGLLALAPYFSVAPFFGTLLAILLLNEPVTPQLLVAGLLMALGVWLHLSEQHEHGHRHSA